MRLGPTETNRNTPDASQFLHTKEQELPTNKR
jgi:hypothetical protein